MMWLLAFIVGLLVGAGSTWGALTDRLHRAALQSEKAAGDRERSRQSLEAAIAKRNETAQREADLERRRAAAEAELNQRMQQQEAALAERHGQFEARVIKYDEYVRENQLLKRDLRNMQIAANKHVLDGGVLRGRQTLLDERSLDIARRYLADAAKWAAGTLTTSNFVAVKDRLITVVERCRSIGFAITDAEVDAMVAGLKVEFERLVRIAVQREEQAKIKAQIREEERLQREAQRAIEQASRDKAMVESALAAALATAQGQHTAEVARLQGQLAEAEAKSVRAISMAQQTKAGNVYIISNLGAFGDGVFKIGMTRRLEPMDRVKELGDASVPFPFDVHAMVSCEDAPALENALHRALHHNRLNKVNPRKEFFRVELATILDVVRKNFGEIEYVADVAALEYRESLTMTDADAAFIEQVYEEADGEKVAVEED